jgi:DNA-binding XRE family transcriptional regulator
MYAIRVWHAWQGNTGIALSVASRISLQFAGSGKRNLLGPLLKRLREERGLTQLKVTALLQLDGWDVSRQVLSFVEDGSRILSDKELFAILRALGHEPAALKDAFSKFCLECNKARKASRRVSGG